jgi:hypothetical protein
MSTKREHGGGRQPARSGSRALRGRFAPRAVVALGVICAAITFSVGASNDDDAVRNAARLAHENVLLKRQIDLATGKGFYLALDPQTKKLHVMLAGVTLREYDVQRMQVAVPRVFSCSPKVPADWVETVWRKGVLDPSRDRDRFEIIATGDSTTMPDVPIPPLPEEVYEVPARYWIRYPGGFSIEIRPETGTGMKTEALTFWQSLWEPMRKAMAERAAADTEAVRLVLQLNDEGAAALYRSLPPDTDFLILYNPEPPK